MIVVRGTVSARPRPRGESKSNVAIDALVTLALKDSIAALSVGLPGRLKSSGTPCIQAQWLSAREVNSVPLSQAMTAGRPREGTAGSGKSVKTNWLAGSRSRPKSLREPVGVTAGVDVSRTGPLGRTVEGVRGRLERLIRHRYVDQAA